jgi:hypothetical protein
MIMKSIRQFVPALALGLVALAGAAASYALTPPALKMSDGANTVTIDSTAAVTFSGACTPATCSTSILSVQSGSVIWGGKLGSFSISVAAGLTKPLAVPNPSMDLSLQSISTATGGTLTIEWTDINFTPAVTTIASAIGGAMSGSGSILAKTYSDAANAPFGQALLAGTVGPFSSSPFSGNASGPAAATAPFSVTQVVSLTLGAGSTLGLDFAFTGSGSPPPPPLECRMTGGGVDTNYNWDHTLLTGEMITNGAGHLPAGLDRYQFGGQVGAPTASQPQPWGEWQHHQHTGPSGSFSFHGGTASAAPGTRIVEVRCSDPGFCNPARPAPNKQIDWDGIGTFSNLGKGGNAPHFLINANVAPEPAGQSNKDFTYHWYEVNVDDLGEPGGLNSAPPNSGMCPGRGFGEKSAGPFYPDPVNSPGSFINLPATALANCGCPDFYRITIYDGVLASKVTRLPDGRIDPTSLDRTNVIYEVYGYIDGGNLQIHPPTGSNK